MYCNAILVPKDEFNSTQKSHFITSNNLDFTGNCFFSVLADYTVMFSFVKTAIQALKCSCIYKKTFQEDAYYLLVQNVCASIGIQEEVPGTRTPGVPNSFIFMQFLCTHFRSWRPLRQILDPPLGVSTGGGVMM